MGPQVAFIGLGNMGQAMAKNLVLKGNLSNPLILYNRRASRASALAAKMGSPTVAATLLDAVNPSDIIFCCLTDERAVTEIFDTILENSVQGKLFVDCSTIGPQYTNRLAARLQVAGAEFVAMPGMQMSTEIVTACKL
ncbi:MAG: hypothetical protein Q9214_005526 [Letrouitia sp. 1 TL-2023]